MPITLWNFALRWRTPRECLSRSAATGGDASTIGRNRVFSIGVGHARTHAHKRARAHTHAHTGVHSQANTRSFMITGTHTHRRTHSHTHRHTHSLTRAAHTHTHAWLPLWPCCHYRTRASLARWPRLTVPLPLTKPNLTQTNLGRLFVERHAAL